ncbi:MAG: hypothetical protein JW913_14865 [Chitinispirillaceae bacterium]|nr:hypothetical protein [Chitinispirillaceae bacterium]
MTGTLCNRFELELEYNSPLRTDPRRKPMLASLFSRGLVTRQQVRDLLKWPGKTMVSAGLAGKKVPLERWLDIKICVDEKSIVTAKAYLGFAPVLPRIGW